MLDTHILKYRRTKFTGLWVSCIQYLPARETSPVFLFKSANRGQNPDNLSRAFGWNRGQKQPLELWIHLPWIFFMVIALCVCDMIQTA